MTFKLLGAILVIIGCGGMGSMIALNAVRETKALKDTIRALEFMECELQFRLTPLPELLRLSAEMSSGIVESFFKSAHRELELHTTPNAGKCMLVALESCSNMPSAAKGLLTQLCKNIGKFDLEGQIKEIESIRTEARKILESHSKNMDTRLRSYKTLGLCAGAALIILFI